MFHSTSILHVFEISLQTFLFWLLELSSGASLKEARCTWQIDGYLSKSRTLDQGLTPLVIPVLAQSHITFAKSQLAQQPGNYSRSLWHDTVKKYIATHFSLHYFKKPPVSTMCKQKWVSTNIKRRFGLVVWSWCQGLLVWANVLINFEKKTELYCGKHVDTFYQ